MGYTNKTFVELMGSIYMCYGKITPGELMENKDTMQALYHVEEPIEIFFYNIEMKQEFRIAGNHPFTKCQLSGMGIAHIPATQ